MRSSTALTRLRTLTFSFLLLGSISTVPLQAELRTVDLGSFSEDSVRLDFRHRGSAHDDASEALADWGIQMAGVAGTVPTHEGWSEYCVICVLPYIYPVVEMDADESNGPHPLILNSRHPLQRVGLELVHTPWDQPVSLTITAQDAVGNVLGTYETIMSDERFTIGLEDSDERPISRVVFSYGEGSPETLLAVIAEFAERPVFKTYFAQIGDGRLPDGESLTSSIVVTNLSSSTAEGSIEFFDDLGEPAVP